MLLLSAPCSAGNRLNADRPSAEISSSRPPADFLVTVYTSDMADAGYEGELSVQVGGKGGGRQGQTTKQGEKVVHGQRLRGE